LPSSLPPEIQIFFKKVNKKTFAKETKAVFVVPLFLTARLLPSTLCNNGSLRPGLILAVRANFGWQLAEEFTDFAVLHFTLLQLSETDFPVTGSDHRFVIFTFC
jgi:hypothetical protein